MGEKQEKTHKERKTKPLARTKNKKFKNREKEHLRGRKIERKFLYDVLGQRLAKLYWNGLNVNVEVVSVEERKKD
jgi:hypothetical protein